MNECNKRMRCGVAWLVTVAMLVAPLALSTAHAQSPRDQARQYFVRGAQLYQQGNYAAAIGQFQAADRLVAHPLNQFNIGLAYEKMGSHRPAITHFNEYLRRSPGAPNAQIVQGKVSRLEAEIAAKGAAKGAAATQRAAAKKTAAEAKRKQEADRLAAEAKRKAAAKPEPVRPPPEMIPVTPPVRSTAPPSPPAVTGSTNDPNPRPPVSTGDPQLDRVAAIDIAALRTARNISPRGAAQPALAGNPAAATGPRATGATPQSMASDAAATKKTKPFYKQWWFWVVVGVSAVILIDIASGDDGTDSTNGGTARLSNSTSRAVLLRF